MNTDTIRYEKTSDGNYVAYSGVSGKRMCAVRKQDSWMTTTNYFRWVAKRSGYESTFGATRNEAVRDMLAQVAKRADVLRAQAGDQ